MELLRQFIKFGIVGVMNTCSSWLIYYPLIFLNFNYILATTIAYILSSILGYCLNHKWVFKSPIYDSNSVLKYYIVYGSSYLINITCMWLFVDILKISTYLAPILTLCVTVPYNFIFNRIWVFTQKENKYLKEAKKYHTFAICAYKNSPYLEECIKSILNQTIKSNVIIASSTKNSHIDALAKKYHIQTFYREGKSDIQDDWNYAVKCSKTELVTVAHQDDVYYPNYLENILSNYTGKERMLFSDNDYYINGESKDDKNLRIKRVIRIPLTIPWIRNIRWIRKRTLSLGNSVQCPSVTYNKDLLKPKIFTSDLKFALDWDTFLKIYKMKGKIQYIPLKLMAFRISDEATTKKSMDNSLRVKEDTIMFSKFWPKRIVKMIMKHYVKCYEVYQEEK